MNDTTADETLQIVRTYHRAWTTTKDFAAAASLLSETLETDLPVNAYAGKRQFVEAVKGFGSLVSRSDMLSENASDGAAVLIYDLNMAPLGVLRIAEQFTVINGQSASYGKCTTPRLCEQPGSPRLSDRPPNPGGGTFVDMSYVPPPETLRRYGEVMVNYGLGNGAGIKPGDVVGVICPEDAKPLLLEIAKAVWRAGGQLIVEFRPGDDADWNMQKAFYEIASDEQLDFYPDAYRRSYFDTIDHYLAVLASRDLQALAGVDPDKQSRHARSRGQENTYLFAAVKAGTMSWSGGLYGTEALAAEAGMSLEEYWEQIIYACHLDNPDPVARWRATAAEIRQTVSWLNRLDIERLHVEADGTDLWLTVGEQRRWIGGESVNVPSFEIATSPDWRGTEGHIAFSEPLYRNGTVMRGIRLTFADGEVVDAIAEEGDAELKAMIATDPGAARIGEYSLTDGRHSRITRFMATTLYDENRGGPAGNTHLALGNSMEEMCFTGDVAAATPEQFAALGFNTSSSIHVDIISTSDRTVTAILKNGSTKVIYAGGQFQNG